MLKSASGGHSLSRIVDEKLHHEIYRFLAQMKMIRIWYLSFWEDRKVHVKFLIFRLSQIEVNSRLSTLKFRYSRPSIFARSAEDTKYLEKLVNLRVALENRYIR